MVPPTSEQIALPPLLLLAHDNAGSTDTHAFQIAYDAARLVFPIVRVDMGAASVGMKKIGAKENLVYGSWNRHDSGPGVFVFDKEGWYSGFPQEFASNTAHGHFVALSAIIISMKMRYLFSQENPFGDMPRVVRTVRHHLEDLGIDPVAIHPQGLSVTAASLRDVVSAMRLDATKREQALAEFLNTREPDPSIPIPHY